MGKGHRYSQTDKLGKKRPWVSYKTEIRETGGFMFDSSVAVGYGATPNESRKDAAYRLRFDDERESARRERRRERDRILAQSGSCTLDSGDDLITKLLAYGLLFFVLGGWRMCVGPYEFVCHPAPVVYNYTPTKIPNLADDPDTLEYLRKHIQE